VHLREGLDPCTVLAKAIRVSGSELRNTAFSLFVFENQAGKRPAGDNKDRRISPKRLTSLED
jgi:hypothetical protein